MNFCIQYVKQISKAFKNLLPIKALASFLQHRDPDRAAALTYYLVFSFIPMILAVISLLGILGLSQYLLDHLLPFMQRNLTPELFNTLKIPLITFRDFKNQNFAFLVALISMVWSASKYISGFGRALDAIYYGENYRTKNSVLLKLRILVLTIVLLLLLVLSTGFFMVSEKLINFIVTVGNLEFSLPFDILHILRLPVLFLCFVSLVALLYFASPSDFSLKNYRKGRAFFPGASFAIILGVIITIGFINFVEMFQRYNAIYGALAGTIILLFWFWIINCTLLFGAELNHHLDTKRARKRTFKR